MGASAWHHAALLQVSKQRILRVVLLATVTLGTNLSVEAGGNRATRSGQEPFSTDSHDALVAVINERMRQSWSDNEVSPSAVADDAEWLRRAYLDIVGHIPPVEEVEAFLTDDGRAKRTKLIDRLLEDPGYVRNWTTIWTNLAIGRQTPRGVSRRGMQKFFREAFSKNRSWRDVVVDLISAEGHYERNGAVNFLLAQMTARDEGVQATAKTTRLLLGIQVQCTQCHDHPFNNWQQSQFWQFNSFFRQSRRIDERKYDPQSGRMVLDHSKLVNEDVSGPVYFERRNGQMQVAFPQFFKTKIDPGFETDRRAELAKLATQGEKPLIATAMVNRVWGHFFGYGFTTPVDDMGPHKPPSHPELVDRLAREFVESGYDVKQLIRWITNCEAYQLTSRFGKENISDAPATGTTPLFSHMYVKSMVAEQLFDSLIIATGANRAGGLSWDEAEKQRQDWLRQFVVVFGTDENDETTTFNGTIPQALMLMNGPAIQRAIGAEEGSYLHRLLAQKGSDSKKVRQLFLATLGRSPTRAEVKKLSQIVRSGSDRDSNFQDLFWALLNSNEFIFNH
jgi:hypothetical protein